MRFRHLAVGAHRFEAGSLDQLDVRLKRRKGIRQHRRESLQPVGVQAAGIVRRPGTRARHHSGGAGIQALARGFIIGG